MAPRDEGRRRGRARAAQRGVLLLLLALFLLGLGAFLLAWIERPAALDEPAAWVAEIESLILSAGIWGVALAILLMVLHSFVPFPAEFLAIANGMLYGPWWGALVTWTGAMLGAWLAFALARQFGRPLALRFLPERQHARLDRWTAADGGLALLLARLIPVFSFNLINFAAGLTPMRWWTFTWATAIGILPLTFLMSFLGHGATGSHWPLWLTAAALGGLSLLLWRSFRRASQQPLASANVPREGPSEKLEETSNMAGRIDARLRELKVAVPEPAAPVANYVGFVRSGNLVFVSGQVPSEGGEIKYIGKVGAELSLEEGQKAARICAVNIIAQLKVACGGDLDRVKRIVRLGGFVNSAAGFKDQPKVINGASDLIVEVFGESGRHCRTALSAGGLPVNVAVEIDAIAEIE